MSGHKTLYIGIAPRDYLKARTKAPKSKKPLSKLRQSGQRILAPRRHPGQAKREPGSQKDKRFNLLRSRIRLRLSGMTVVIRWRARQTLLRVVYDKFEVKGLLAA